MKSSATQTGTFGDKLQEANKKAKELDEQLNGKLTKSIEVMGAAVAAGGAIAIKSSIDFGKEMVKVKTLLDETVMSYEDAKQMVLETSKDTGVTAGDLANAAYDALSAGVKTADLSKVLSATAKTTRAGFTDAGTAMDVLTTIMNSYGIESSKVTEITDKLLMTQDKGKVTVGELAQGLGGLVGISSQAGVSLDEVLAGVAALTANGLPASTSINSIKMAISGMIKPTGEAQKMAQNLGIKFSAQALQAKGLSGVLEEVQRKTGGNTEKMAQLFGSVEALNAVMILTGKQGSKTFSDSLIAIGESSGKMDKTFKMIMEESGEEFSKALNELAISAIEVGNALSPVISLLAGFLAVLAAIDPQVIIIIGSLIMVATVALKVAQAIDSMSKLSGPVGTFFTGFNVAAQKTVLVVLAVVAALIALVAVIAVLFGKGNDLDRTMGNVANSVGQMQSTVTSAGRQPPRYATGTGYHRGGGAIITEYGAEQLTLPNGSQYVVMPRGTRVDNANQTQKMLKANSRQPTPSYGNINVYVDHLDDIDHLMRIANGARQSQRQGYAGR